MSTLHAKIFVKQESGDPSTSLNLGEFGLDITTNSLYIGTGIFTEPILIMTLGCIKLTYDDIANVSVENVYGLSDWNAFFDLPANIIRGVAAEKPFVIVYVYGNVVKLYAINGTKIYLKDSLFDTAEAEHLLGFEDDTGIVSEIGTNSFPCVNLTTVSFTGATVIQNEAFSGDINLININFPVLTTAGSSCFESCTSLVNPNFPVLTTAGSSCFESCTSLVNPNFPALMAAGDSCFNGCTSLVNPNFPALIEVGDSCFNGCTSLVNPNFPALIEVRDSCFLGCISYTNINLPSLTTLGTTVGDDGVFASISDLIINLTVQSILMTNNSDAPDGDIQTLQGANTVHVTVLGSIIN